MWKPWSTPLFAHRGWKILRSCVRTLVSLTRTKHVMYLLKRFIKSKISSLFVITVIYLSTNITDLFVIA